MKLLLDTHAVVRWLKGDGRLSSTAFEAIRAADHRQLVSAASVWELSIKRATGRYDGEDLLGPARAAGFHILPIDGDHAKLAGALPLHHRDPFDRILVAQAKIEDRVLVSGDQMLPRYGVPVIW